MSQTQKAKATYTLSIFAIMMVYLVSFMGEFESPAVQLCIEAWPDVPSASIRTLTTLPGLFQTLVMLLISPLAGKKIGYRTCSLIGLAMISIGGVLPTFVHPTWSFVLVCRAVLGSGVGFLAARNAYLLKCVPPEEASRWIGIGGILPTLAMIVGAPVCGFLADIAWNYTFLINGIAIVCFIVVLLFLREPEERDADEEASASGIKSKINPMGYVYAVFLFLSTVVLYPLLTGLSTFFAEKNLGTAALAGTIISVYTAGGIVANVFLVQQQKLYKKLLPAVCCLEIALGQALILFVPSMPLIVIGTFIAGLGYMTLLSIFQVYNGMIQPADRLDFTSIIILVGSQLSIFASSYYITASNSVINFHGSEIESAFLGCAIVHAILLLVSLFGKIVPDEKTKESEAA